MRMKPTVALIAAATLASVGAIAFAQTDSTTAQPDTSATPDVTPPAPPANSDTIGVVPPSSPPGLPSPMPKPLAGKPGAPGTATLAPGDQAPATPPIPTGPPPTPPNAVLVMTGLDKITGRPTRIVAHLNQPVEFATLTITAHYCYSTPQSETPETSAFLQIEDHRPDQPRREVFSGWMYASSPGLNGLQHPLYDVWVISCSANVPGQTRPTVASMGAVKVRSPDSSDKEGLTALPEGAGQ
jgi:hypothetical protein